jgi:hypothetical protein
MLSETYKQIMQHIRGVLHNPTTSVKYTMMSDGKHAKKSLRWLLRINPSASFALKVATFGHDIERAVFSAINPRSFSSDQDYRTEHSLRSANIVREIALRYYIPEIDLCLEAPRNKRYFKYFSLSSGNVMLPIEEDEIDLIWRLILNHEVGSKDDQNLNPKADDLKDADKLANLQWYDDWYSCGSIEEKVAVEYGIKNIFDRISLRNRKFARQIEFKNREIEELIRSFSDK